MNFAGKLPAAQRSPGAVQPQQPLAAPSRPRPHDRWLSRAGNQAVQQVVGRGGWVVAPPGDAREIEARRVAQDAVGQNGVTSLSNPGRTQPPENSPGSPVRRWIQERFQTDLGDVRLHTDARAAESARRLNALAYTAGRDVVFAAGQYRPDTPAGQRLLAHELAHAAQNRDSPAADGNRLWRQETGESSPDTTTDAAAHDAGPCGVVEGTLSNQGLLFQLNRARLYLTRHERGEDEWYDYANLLRRLTAERRRRVGGGHVWLAEAGLITAPDELYVLTTTGGLEIVVSRVPGSAVSGAYRPEDSTYMTRGQFENFLANNNVQSMNIEDAFAAVPPDGPAGVSLTLPAPEERTRMAPAALPPGGLFLRTDGNPMASPFPFPGSPFGGAGAWGGSGGPGFNFFEPGGAWSPYGGGIMDPLGGGMPGPWDGFYERERYTPGAGELIGDVRSLPGLVTSDRPERVYYPAPSPAPASPPGGDMGYNPFILPVEAEGDYSGAGALGYLGRPGIGLPEGTTGILWEGSHVVDIAVLNERMFGRGFRASGAMHTADFLTPTTGRPRAILNVGAPGSYANDFAFGYGGEIWGRPPLSSGHWRGGSVAVVRADGSPLAAAELIELMVASAPGMEGLEYRYSPPPEGSPAFASADVEARRRGLAGFCPAGGHNCINVPEEIHSVAMAGNELQFIRPDGTVIDLSDPAYASARNMSEFMNQPDSFFEARGLRRVRIGPRLWGGVGAAGGLGVGTSVGADLWSVMEGDDVALGPAAARATISGGSSAASVFAEDFAYTALTTRLVSSGMSAGPASTLSRLGAGTGVGVVAAPLTTGLTMAAGDIFFDEDPTRSDYAANMTRSTVAAGGGALASGIFFAAMGSGLPVAGTILGFLIGVGGYYLMDWLVGDEVEEAVREAMGEYGCTGGVGAGH